MPLNLTAKQLAKLTGKKPEPSPKKASIPRERTERAQIGEARGLVTHKLFRTLDGKYDHVAPIGSLACAEWVLGINRWSVRVYLELGELRFDMRGEEFPAFFEEVSECQEEAIIRRD